MSPVATLFGIGITVAAYCVSRWLARRYPSPLTTPVFFSTTLVVLALLTWDVSLEDYQPAKEIMTYLLGPATVALAVPLYKHWPTLLRHLLPVMAGLVVGSLSALTAAVFIAKFFALSDDILASLSIKSVTAPVAIELATLVGGDSTLTAVFVVVTGMIGAMFGPWLLSVFRIDDPVARGLALGTVSHGQGTAQAVIEGELQGAAAGIAMGLAAVFVSSIAPLLVPYLL